MNIRSSRAEASLFILALFLAVQLVSLLTPPFQSPDEDNHVERAYLLGRGIVFVGDGKSLTGGMIDRGLLKYVSCFYPLLGDYSKKRDKDIPSSCQEIHFTHTESFGALPNTAMYFPLAYLPQAIALFAGEQFGWRVADAYYLARILSSIATLGILWWAMLIYPVPPICIALFAMPMCLFQLASASLDPVTFALSALVAALFLRGMDRGRSFEELMHTTLAAAIFVLATSRIVYVILVTLLVTIAWRRSSWRFVVSSLIVATLSLSWIVFVLENVHELKSHQMWGSSQLSTVDIVKSYMFHPGSLVAVFSNTLSDSYLLLWHWRSFVGLLGYFDTPVDAFVYIAFGVLLVSLVIFSLARSKFHNDVVSNMVLAGAGFMSLFLIFFLALVGWNLYPAKVIEGVQGRYFYPPFMLLAYAVTPCLGPTERKVSVTGIALVAVVSMIDVVIKLKLRYG